MEEKVLDVLMKTCEDEIVKVDRNIDLFETGLLDSLATIELFVELKS